MRTRTKKILIWQLFGVTVVCGLTAALAETLPYAEVARADLPVFIAIGAVHLLFCYVPVRAITGLRIGRLFGLGKPKPEGELTVTLQSEKNAGKRHFSWLLLLTTPAVMAAPVWLFLRQTIAVTGIVAGSAFGALILVALLVPTAESRARAMIQAHQKAKAEKATE